MTNQGGDYMNAYERYYRRSYNAINRLIDAYKTGYTKENSLKFREELLNKYKANPITMRSEICNIMFTTMICLLGLNKEAIENTGKIIEYKKNNNELNIDENQLTIEQKQRLKEFNDSKVVNTDFDNWLSIKINPNTDKENIDFLRRVRNSLLHSNFYLDEDTPFMPFTKLKTKSYYEAEIFNLQFQMFVFEYFANIDSLGLSEAIYAFDVPKTQISNQDDFINHLLLMNINKITYQNLQTVGVESPELFLRESTDSDFKINVSEFAKKLKYTKNADNIKWETMKLSSVYVINVIRFIKNTYGEKFYSLDSDTQNNILTTHIKYELNPKSEISNWMCHFWYLYSTLTNSKFNISFFDGDEYGMESCYPALMILKSYLLMYRLQNNNFDEIDYSKIDFDINDKDIQIISENKDQSPVTEDYFQKSFDKEKSKGILTEEKEIWNKIICEVVRDSLAHGNIRTYTSPLTLEPMIELKDIDPKKGTTRVIIISLSKYEKFLNSEAFIPSNCYKKEETKKLVKNK